MITVSGDVAFKVEIRCGGCGRLALSHHHITLVSVPARELEAQLQYEFNHRIPDIPVGWSMSGRDNLKCENCT